MIIRNGLVFEEDKTFSKRDLYIENGRIVASADEVTDQTVVDAEGLYVLPGLIDIHSHGAVGCDFSDGDVEGLRSILRYQRAHGITSYCPTSMTLPLEQLKTIFATAVAAEENADALTEDLKQAHIAGINMEGPFLDPIRKGAHVPGYIMEPDVAFFRECNESCNHMIRLVTLAPNVPGAMDFIRELHDETVISLGHTAANYEEAKAAFDAGASHVTHLYNTMLPLAHREPGLIGAAAEADHVMPELISDGVHIHGSVIRATFKLFPDRVVLVSDSMRAAGLADGEYDLGGQMVTVCGKRAALADGTLAGSSTNLYDCMRTAVSFDIPLGDAIAAATMNPAKSIGIFEEVGSLTPGKRADIVLADQDLNLIKVIS